MAYIPQLTPGGGLAPMRKWHGPNIVCFSRAAEPPIPGMAGGKGAENDEAGDGEESPEAGNKREIRGISRASKLAIARVLSSIDWTRGGQCVHLTFTYRDAWPTTKEDLAKVKSALTARCGDVGCGIWRLEYQARGAPHFHVLLWVGNRALEEVETYLRRKWAGISGNDHAQALHVSAGTEGRAAWYLALHAAKEEQAPLFAVGRWWGYVRREQLRALYDVHTHGDAVDREAVRWKRLCRRHQRAQRREARAAYKELRFFQRCMGIRLPSVKGLQQYRNASGFTWFLPRGWQTRVGAWVVQDMDRQDAERHAGGWARPLPE